MATVDTLLVRIEADMSGIRRDLQRLERQTGDASKKMQSNFSKMEPPSRRLLVLPLLGLLVVLLPQMSN